MGPKLLDFTENPLVALWFACADKPERDGKVFAVDIGDPLAWTNGRKVERPLDEDQGLVYYEPDRSLGVRIVAQQSVFLVCNPRIPEWAVKEEKIPRDAKSGLREALERLGLSDRVLFVIQRASLTAQNRATSRAWRADRRRTLAPNNTETAHRSPMNLIAESNCHE